MDKHFFARTEPGRRQFEPVTLSANNLDPSVVSGFQAMRSDKETRRLAVLAKNSLRHLIDVAALDALLDQAARYALDDQGSPAEYLHRLIRDLAVELSQTKGEHEVLADRVGARTMPKAIAAQIVGCVR
jgi:hypothetical protein